MAEVLEDSGPVAIVLEGWPEGLPRTVRFLTRRHIIERLDQASNEFQLVNESGEPVAYLRKRMSGSVWRAIAQLTDHNQSALANTPVAALTELEKRLRLLWADLDKLLEGK